MNVNKKFWMVVGESGPPTVRHCDEEAARNEAKRLAIAHKGQEFTVLESIVTVKTVDVEWTNHVEDVDYPAF